MLNILLQENFKKKKYKKRLIIFGVFFALLVLCVVYGLLLFSPVVNTTEKRITIEKGYSVTKTSELLEQEGIISSALAFNILARFDKESIKSGQYIFEVGTIELQQVFNRLSSADYGDVYERLTIPEGSTNRQIADTIKRSSFEIDLEKFDVLTEGTEGYLFPDTYNFLPDTDVETIIDVMKSTFDAKIKSLELEITKSKRTLEEIIIMASLIEKEATGNIEEKKIVSGILWKRLDQGMLLQVDAPFQYIHGVVRAADLRKDGPYNTYTRLGLTPTPIGNPGLDSIIAALEPTSTRYYYYLHGKDGLIRYGVNYNQHINNINRYLR
jgi:UPF0755 protein